jgi:hypothetical protein
MSREEEEDEEDKEEREEKEEKEKEEKEAATVVARREASCRRQHEVRRAAVSMVGCFAQTRVVGAASLRAREHGGALEF